MGNDKPYIIDGMRVSKDEYNRHKSDSFLVRFKKGSKDKIKAHTESLGMSLNAYITS